jgi:glycosyltransferase involved in cell wall biosynthesis
MQMNDNDAPLLLDASRLVWRRWAGTRSTGIDRICFAWMRHFGPRAQAVIIHRRGQAILPFGTSQKLFDILAQPDRTRGDKLRFRAALVALALRSGVHLRDRLEGRGRLWLNAGHTGLDVPGVSEWAQRKSLRPIHLVHDLIPITHPQYCREGESERHRQRMLTVLGTAIGVVVNSAHTLDSLAAFAAAEDREMPQAKVVWPGTPQLTMPRSGSKTAPSFVVLGTIEGRKNHSFLLSLWRSLIASNGLAATPRLFIVGRRGWQADDVFAQLDSGEFGDRVVELGPLDDDRLADVLAGSRALLFPSSAEGYGIPLVEALAAKVPVIASDLPVFREIGQGVPELLPLNDLAAWQDAVREYAQENGRRRSAQLTRLPAFKAPGWERHFARLDAFISALS